jgi:hypothetical protein
MPSVILIQQQFNFIHHSNKKTITASVSASGNLATSKMSSRDTSGGSNKKSILVK